MRLIIVPSDGVVNIDGVSFDGLDLSFIDASIHAVQWYETRGEIELKNPITGRMVANEAITSIDAFEPAVSMWQEAKFEQEQAIAEAEAAAAEAAAAEAAAAEAAAAEAAANTENTQATN